MNEISHFNCGVLNFLEISTFHFKKYLYSTISHANHDEVADSCIFFWCYYDNIMCFGNYSSRTHNAGRRNCFISCGLFNTTTDPFEWYVLLILLLMTIMMMTNHHNCHISTYSQRLCKLCKTEISLLCTRYSFLEVNRRRQNRLLQ